MYLPEHFREDRVEVMHELIRARPLGTMVTLTANGLEANHLPFEIDAAALPYGVLRAHIARSNPLWKNVSDGTEALVIFRGVDEYISPSWYPTKRQTGKVVPTWNYVAVHAHGPLKFIEDRTWLRDFIEGLTDRHEGRFSVPWKVSDAPQEYIDNMLGAIVGIEITVGKLQGKWKVSQNRPAGDRDGVAQALEERERDAAREMAQLVRKSGGDV